MKHLSITTLFLLIIGINLTSKELNENNFSKIQSNNLIYNGDFSLGNVGFDTDYIFGSIGNFKQGYYTITDNPQIFHPGFAPCKDYTRDAAGLMMIFDSFSSLNKLVWKQKVNVDQNADYSFKMNATKLVYYDDSELLIKINGQQVAKFKVTHMSCTWNQLDITWNSQINTEAEIEIFNLTTIMRGNDLAIDDISLTKLKQYDGPNVEDKEYYVCLGQSLNVGEHFSDLEDWEFSWEPKYFLNDYYASNPTCTPQTNITYEVILTHKHNNMKFKKQVKVQLFQTVSPKIFKDSELYCSKNVSLIAEEGYQSFLWSTGDTSRIITISQPGTYILHALDSNGCSVSNSILIESKYFAYNIPQSISLGNVCIGSTKSVKSTLYNIGDLHMKIDSIYFENDYGFKVFDPENKKFILSKDSLSILISSDFIKSGQKSANLKVRISEPCVFELDIFVSAIINDEHLNIFMPDTTVNVGEKVCLPIRAFSECNGSNIPANYEIKVKFNKSIFSPEYVQSGRIVSIGENSFYHIVHIEDYTGSRYINNIPSDINYICGTILLSDIKRNILEISEFKQLDSLNYSNYNGSITIDQCAFQIRQVNAILPIRFDLIQDSETINIISESNQIGNYNVKIIDINGRIVLFDNWSQISKESIYKSILFSKSFLSQGIYIIVYQAPWEIRTEKFAIID